MRTPLPGIAFAVLAQMIYATALLIVNRRLGGISPFLVNFGIVSVGALSLVPVVLLMRRDLGSVVKGGKTPWRWLLLVGVIWVAASQTLFVVGAQIGDPRSIALTSLFFPVFVTLIEFGLGKSIDIRFGVGFLLMALGFAVILLRSS